MNFGNSEYGRIKLATGGCCPDVLIPSGKIFRSILQDVNRTACNLRYFSRTIYNIGEC